MTVNDLLILLNPNFSNNCDLMMSDAILFGIHRFKDAQIISSYLDQTALF